jgi:hypothetical protein
VAPLGALLFRNLTNDVARSLLEPAASGPDYTLECEEPVSIADGTDAELGVDRRAEKAAARK